MSKLNVERDIITAQASSAISADSTSSGTITVLHKDSSGNIDEDTQRYLVYAKITSRPSATAKINALVSTSTDGASYTSYEYIQTPLGQGKVEVDSGSGTIYRYLGSYPANKEYTKFMLEAEDYGFTAECIVEYIYTTTEVT